MGIFDRLKNQKVAPETEKRPLSEFAIRSRDNGYEVFAYGVSNEGQIQHRNKEITDLIIARIIKYRQGNAIAFDNASYVSFELAEGEELNEQMIYAVMKQYDAKTFANDNRNQYLGRIEGNEGYYTLGNRSYSVEKIAEKIVSEYERKREEKSNNRVQETKSDFKQEITVGNNYEQERQEARKKRIQNPTLRGIDSYQMEGKIYSDYNGVNMNTGDVLRIRKVDKVGKDGSGTYLYSAFINTTWNESDVEMLNRENPYGYPVCFTLPKRLEDIVQIGNIHEITKVLELLSVEESSMDREQLTYIGELGKYGDIDRKPIASSNAIQVQIQKMQQEYMRKMMDKKRSEGQR